MALQTVAQGALDLHKSSCEELQIARVYTRHQTQICLASGYNSGDDDSDEDEEGGKLVTERQYHGNGNKKFFKTYQILQAKGSLPCAERLIEEKHFDVSGVCRVDYHFGLGQPYLSRKHFYENQRMKSEQLFFVEDERTMKARKVGYWREYYEGGNTKTEKQYDANGIRTGFCKRYAEDGSLEWVKDYTKDYIERLAEFNAQRGKLDISVEEAAALLGFGSGQIPTEAAEVDRVYRKRCMPLHPDKCPDPDANERFIEVSRAREVLLKHLSSSK
eukprot:CAMPEP_0183599750 /NCGR_PEP_ID=MMETSP0371-20130417/179591_1 /TAXON_ID=268820 /ORGANISM="Peridinium aciculiferum, Strain PAER-2" /LENGTH=273 /DNA_ID=CAMNT_0025811821 /DNA_START=70 /DNA_END=891 /DNA_ORIENTATION=+